MMLMMVIMMIKMVIMMMVRLMVVVMIMMVVMMMVVVVIVIRRKLYIPLTSFQLSLSNNSFTTSSCLFITATSKQFRPPSILTSGSAPFSRRKDTLFLQPFMQAMCRALVIFCSQEIFVLVKQQFDI
jgi:hypothetical protein